MNLKIIMIIMGLILFGTGCSDLHIQDKVIEKAKVTNDQVMLEQMKNTSLLFDGINGEYKGKLLELKEDYSHEALLDNVNDKNVIDFGMKFNNPQYIDVIVKYIKNDDGEIVDKEIDKRKYTIEARHLLEPHRKWVKEHGEENLPNQTAYLIAEDDGYEYVHCSICDQYIGGYGKKLSPLIKDKLKQYPEFTKVVEWMEQVEKTALSQIWKAQIDEISTGIEKYTYCAQEIIDGVVYKYTPYGRNGGEFGVFYIPASIYKPEKYTKEIKKLEEVGLVLSNYYLNGKTKQLEFKNADNYTYDYDKEGNDNEYTSYDYEQNQCPIIVDIFYEREKNLPGFIIRQSPRSITPLAYIESDISRIVETVFLDKQSTDKTENIISDIENVLLDMGKFEEEKFLSTIKKGVTGNIKWFIDIKEGKKEPNTVWFEVGFEVNK